MGIFNFFRQVVDSGHLGRETVKKQIEVYYMQRNLYPDQAPHVHLAQTWLSRQKANGADITDGELQTKSYGVTLLLACIPHPRCAEALGLQVLLEERPDIFSRHPEFKSAYKNYVESLLDMPKEAVMKLYRINNPQMPEESISMLFT